MRDRSATESTASTTINMETKGPIHITDDLHFQLTGDKVDYRFHVDPDSRELILDHFGGCTGDGEVPSGGDGGVMGQRKEFPDHGRGDYRLPAIHIRHGEGHTVTQFEYSSHKVVNGKPKLPRLPATFGSEESVQTLLITMKDSLGDLEAVLSYSVFPKENAVVRSFSVTNKGAKGVTIERAASLSVDMAPKHEEYDMIQLNGDWGRECQRTTRKIDYGTQGFQSSNGYSSHYHNPFVGIAPHSTTDTKGEAYGFSLVWSGSFSVDIEKWSPGLTRVMIGLNPLHLAWPLGPGETFQCPECVAVYEPAQGFGGMSRSFHNLYRHHLSRSKYTLQPRPFLANNWEATEFDIDDERLYGIAKSAADLGVSLYVMDDGWFGDKHPRTNDRTGLGDWVPNPKRFPHGLENFIERVNKLKPLNKQSGMQFGLWVEPEMVNPDSDLYERHPDWALHAGKHPRTESRNQLVLNFGLPEVQEYIIEILTKLLSSNNISYVKWDKNRAINELPSPDTAHRYVLGFYHVVETITSRFPDILFEGCAGGGGRFDPGLLYYFPQNWTSDDTDALERVYIQMGVTLVYPASTMGCHISAVPNDTVGRTTPFEFRAHVAMMGGSPGIELDPATLSEEEKELLPKLIDLSDRVNPYVIKGDLYRLALPQKSNWPGVQYVLPDAGESVVIAMRLFRHASTMNPNLVLQGLEEQTMYEVRIEGGETCSRTGGSLMNAGMKIQWKQDYDSKVIWVTPK